MEHRTESRPGTHPVAITALALLGPLFGIATQVWGQALLLLGLAALLILAPPRRAPGAVWWILFLAIGVVGLTAFLPAHWFAIPEWRHALVKDFRVELPGTMSPQPWVSLHAVCLLFSGLVFALYLLGQEWTSQTRRQALRIYTCGILALAVIAIVAQQIGQRPPFWPKVLNLASGFGFFPNRNQTANVLALAGILSAALAFESFQRRWKGAWFWTVAALILGFSLVQAFSRAGILLFFGGIAAWVLVSSLFSKSHKGAALSVAGVALTLTAFFVFGGETLERFLPKGDGEFHDFRFKIHRDAVKLATSAPWLGQGLGNFAPVFAVWREASAEQNRAIHPESDWLWVAVEMGWPAVGLFAGAFLLWLKRCFPFAPGSDRSLRAAAMVCGVAFAAHSFGDVSAHRPGSAWPALLLAGLAMNPSRTAEVRRWVAPVFRMLGLIAALISAWWFVSIWSDRADQSVPTLHTLSKFTAHMEQSSARGEFGPAIVSANEALRITPLSADLYYGRAVARVGDGFSLHGAAMDFVTARFLEPRWIQICLSEGLVWMEVDQPVAALDAWIEALRRAGARAPEYYGRMLGWAHKKSFLRAQLAMLARNSPDYFVVFLQASDRLECELLIGKLLDAEPNLESFSSEQRKALFAVWNQRGDRASLISHLLANPVWGKEGWLWLASDHAVKKEYEQAYRIARESIAVPTLPTFGANQSLSDLERAFRMRGGDFQAGIQFFFAQRAAGMTGEALATLRTLQEAKGRPPYLAFLEAEIWAEKEDWQKAWDALRRFNEKSPR